MARSDVASAPAGCAAGLNGTGADSDCQVGDPDGERTVALIGDSHALQWLPAFQQVARARGWKLYFWYKPACPVVDVPVWSGKAKGPYTTCDGWRDSVMERLAGLPRLDAVFIGRYAGYTRSVIRPDGGRTSAADVAAHWREPVRELFADLLKSAETVVVLRDNPWPGQDVPACLSEHAREPAECAFDRDGSVHRDEPLYDAERAAAKPSGRAVRFVDLTELLCPAASPCPVVSPGGVIMYRDDDHLTASYTESLWGEIDRRVGPLLDRR
jgi:hypothetical protein